MKKTIAGLSLLAGLVLSACSDTTENVLPHDAGKVVTKAASGNQVLLQWNDEKQLIDGFGIAQAGWSGYLYAHRKRDEVMNLLYGNDGLRLSIFRGEVFPHYRENADDKSFHTDENIDLPLDDPFFDIDFDQEGYEKEKAVAQRNGQLWLAKKASEQYHADKLIFSTWSAPAYMKSNGNVSGGSLPSKNYQTYADYLADFCDAYKAAGLNVYAVSPANEPEYPATWNSCVWWPQKSTLGKFIANYMAPTFAARHPEVKIIFGENAQWNRIYSLVPGTGSKDNVAAMLEGNSALAGYPVIAAGHGYTPPKTNVYPTIEPFTAAEEKGIPVWLTEVSGPDYAFDASMADGLKWAKLFHRYLVDAHVGAIIWWAGALPDGGTNEGLIFTGKDRVTYSTTKRFETFGHFSRYIPVGSTRITAEKGNSLPSDVLVSSYKKGNQFTVVAINPTGSEVSGELVLAGAEVNGNLQQAVTDADRRWETGAEVQPNSEGGYTLVLPANSVVTYTGIVR